MFECFYTTVSTSLVVYPASSAFVAKGMIPVLHLVTLSEMSAFVGNLYGHQRSNLRVRLVGYKASKNLQSIGERTVVDPVFNAAPSGRAASWSGVPASRWKCKSSGISMVVGDIHCVSSTVGVLRVCPSV